MAKFLEFNRIQATSELKSKFLQQAQGFNLGTILKNPKYKALHISFHQAKEFPEIYLPMITCGSDFVLMKLAEECSFPRGFPLYWVPDVQMKYFGFYPKFSNDERQTLDNQNEFNEITSINFFKKFSGFLAQLLVFEYNKQIFWTVTSKNSAIFDSPFVQDARRLFEPFMTQELLETMLKENIHICAEVMSQNDQTHGTRVLKETPIITAIGKGCHFDLTNTAGNIVGSKFVEFFDHSALVDFCVKFSLPCDSAIMINNPEASKNFMLELSQNRDFMDDENLNLLVKKHQQHITIKHGTITHAQVLGNCLEGLVLKLTHSNRTTSVKKYKLPKYTIITMLIREQFKNFTFNANLKEKAINFVDYWCVSPKGKDYWFRFGLRAFIKYLDMPENTSNVGDHIILTESMADFDIIHDVSISEFDNKIHTMTNGTVVICVGPIASGKTSIMEQICFNNLRLIPIDGDDLGIGTEKTLKLGRERNEFSRWKIIQCLMNGNVPVISTGGGVLFSTGKKDQEFILRNQIYDTLGILVNIIVILPDKVGKLTQVDNNYDPTSIYDNLALVKSAIIQRVKTGKWKIDPKFKSGKTSEATALANFANEMARRSQYNMKFAKSIIECADSVFVLPIITKENYGIQKTFNYSEICDKITYPFGPMSGKFGQIRLLTFINNVTPGYITLQHSAKNKIVMTNNNLNKLASSYGLGEIKGTAIVMKSDTGKTISFIIPNKNIDNKHDSFHIPLESGEHDQKDINIAVLAAKSKTNAELSTKNGNSISYKLITWAPYTGKIDILAVFAK